MNFLRKLFDRGSSSEGVVSNDSFSSTGSGQSGRPTVVAQEILDALTQVGGIPTSDQQQQLLSLKTRFVQEMQDLEQNRIPSTESKINSVFKMSSPSQEVLKHMEQQQAVLGVYQNSLVRRRDLVARINQICPADSSAGGGATAAAQTGSSQAPIGAAQTGNSAAAGSREMQTVVLSSSQVAPVTAPTQRDTAREQAGSPSAATNSSE